MAWFQGDRDDIRTYGQVHGGKGSIQISRLFRDRLTLPVRVQIWELEPGTSEGDHTHPSNEPADTWEELYYVLSEPARRPSTASHGTSGPGMRCSCRRP